MTSNTITISEADLREIEETHALLKNIKSDEIDGKLKDVFDIIKNRKFTTYDIVINKMGINRRSARNFMEALLDRGLISKQYEFIKCADNVRRKTALYFALEEKKDDRRKKK